MYRQQISTERGQISLTMKKTIYTTALISVILLAGYFFYQTTTLKEQNRFGVRVQQYLIDSISSVQRDFGLSIAKTNCWACHKFYSKHNFLQGVVQRVGEEYLSAFITNQDSLIRIGDTYAIEMKASFSNLKNSHNFNFSKSELTALIEFLR